MKSKLISLLDIFKTPKPIPAGIYTCQSPPEASKPQKFFLRVEPNGFSTLVINASLILHLNPVATEFAYALLHQLDEDQTIRNVLAKYRVNEATVREDYHSFLEKLRSLSETEDLDPIEFFGFERASEKDLEHLSAPYRLDCALTYRLPQDASPIYAPVERVTNELSTTEWKTIIDKAWQVAIPQIIFTGGEPTLRPDLLDLIRHVEDNGQICGLITDGKVFLDSQILNDFLNAGLDHLMLLLDPHNAESWKVVENVAQMDIYTAVHLTLDEKNISQLHKTISRLASSGVNALSLSAISADLSNSLVEASELAAYHGLRLVWDLPVPYSKFNPVRLEIVPEEQRDRAGRAWLYIEPDGDVLPSQGIPLLLGNLLKQEWDEIWKNCQENVKNKMPL